MKLRPIIASYSGETSDNISEYLKDDVLEIIARVARVPVSVDKISNDVLAELIEMHVLKKQGGMAKLDTAVFLKNDIKRIIETMTPLAGELGRRVFESGKGFSKAPPEITHFLGGTIALVQGIGKSFAKVHVEVNWKNFRGKYAKSKIDFDEECDDYNTLGPDYLNKSVIQGERHTAVFIGPIGSAFKTFTFTINTSENGRSYRNNINKFLVDAYAMLVKGEIRSEPLMISAEIANLCKSGRWRTVVITNRTIEEYRAVINTIREVASTCYIEQLPVMEKLLYATNAGRQGVPPEKMMLNFSRYLRKLTAKELYKNGFFKDDIPKAGTMTVFYENNVGFLRQILI